MTRISWLPFALCLFAVGASQQSTTSSSASQNTENLTKNTRPPFEYPLRESASIIVIFADGDYSEVRQDETFSVPKGEKFKTLNGFEATFKYIGSESKSGNLIYQVLPVKKP